MDLVYERGLYVCVCLYIVDDVVKWVIDVCGEYLLFSASEQENLLVLNSG